VQTLFGSQEGDSGLKGYFTSNAVCFWTQTVSRTGKDLHSTKYSLQFTASPWASDGEQI